VQNLRPYDKSPSSIRRQPRRPARTANRRQQVVTEQVIAQGQWHRRSHQGVRHQRRRILQRQQRASIRKPTPFTNFFEMVCIFAISAGLTYTLGGHDRLAQARWAVWGAMAFLFLAGVTTAYWAEARGNPLLTAAGADHR